MAAKRTKDMTFGKPLGLILSFAIPLIFGNLFQQMYNMVDSIIVSKYLGINAFGAVGSVGSLLFLINGFCMGTGTGMAIPIAQCFGAKDEVNLRKHLANAIWMMAALAVVVTALTTSLAWNILNWMQSPTEIIYHAYDYLIVILAGIPATILYNMCAAVMRALGDSKHPLYFLILASILNIGLDLLFIIPLNMGTMGAALATVLSQLISGLCCLVYIIRNLPILHVRKDEWKLSGSHMGTLASNGFPMGLQFSIIAIGSVMLTSAVNALGATEVSAMTAAGKVSMLLNCAYEAMGATMATWSGQNLGARKISRVSKGLKCAILSMMVYCVISFVAMYFFGTTVALLFVDAAETAVLANVRIFLLTNFALAPFLLLVIVLRNVVQGLGYSKVAIIGGVLEMFARSAVAFVLVPVAGFAGASLANPAAWIAADLFFIPTYFIVMHKVKKRIVAVPDEPVLPDAMGQTV